MKKEVNINQCAVSGRLVEPSFTAADPADPDFPSKAYFWTGLSMAPVKIAGELLPVNDFRFAAFGKLAEHLGSKGNLDGRLVFMTGCLSDGFMWIRNIQFLEEDER